MNKPEDKIEELFQGHINDFDKMPDDSLCEDIEASLPPVMTPNHRLWRWGLAAALLLFSLVGYVAYQSINTGEKTDVIGAKDNSRKSEGEVKKLVDKNDAKTVKEANESNQLSKDEPMELMADREAKNNKIVVTEDAIKREKVGSWNKIAKKSENRVFVDPISIIKSSELITPKTSPGNKDKSHKEVMQDVQESALATEDEAISSQTIEKEKNNRIIAVTEKEGPERISAPDYLSGHEANLVNEIPLNTNISYEAAYNPEEKKERFFKTPSEVYISLTPSLNYYRVFSNAIINEFNGANKGGRLGWAVQAGAVYPLKFRRFSYRVGLSYFSAQSNFKYNLISRTQMPIRLNNNTFEYVNVESTQAESKKWQVLEIQNDLMYKVRPLQDFILGFKAGSSFTEKPVFDIYTGYRFARQVNHRQTMWIEAAYAYALNARQSSKNTFSYHMDKYSLKIGVNFR